MRKFKAVRAIFSARLSGYVLFLMLPVYLAGCAAKPIGPMIIEGEYINQGGAMPAAALPAPRLSVIHEVGPGETVWRIGKIYDVPHEDIIRVNRLDAKASLEIGQKLTIPNARQGRKAVIPLYESTKWKYIVIHHSATSDGKALTFNKSHLKRGFSHGLGYHFVIDNGSQNKTDGFIEVSPRWLAQSDGAHC